MKILHPGELDQGLRVKYGKQGKGCEKKFRKKHIAENYINKTAASNRMFYKIENETQKLTLKQKELKSWISTGVENL